MQYIKFYVLYIYVSMYIIYTYIWTTTLYKICLCQHFIIFMKKMDLR